MSVSAAPPPPLVGGATESASPLSPSLGKLRSSGKPLSRPLGANTSEVEQKRVRIVPVDAIVTRIAPLTNMPAAQLRDLVRTYDTNNTGGLSEEQWSRFCHENRRYVASLGVQMIDFDRSGEYTIITLERVEDKTCGGGGPQQQSTFTHGLVKFLESFVAGGIAGAVSKTVIAPGDRVKIIFQVETGRHFSLREALWLATETVKEFGVTGLWIGNGATMLRVVPYAAITYVSFDYYHNAFSYLFQGRGGENKFDEGRAVWVRFLSGAMAGATSTTFTYPLDLMRACFAARSSSRQTRFPSYRVAFRDATKHHGFLSLYSGLFPTLAGIMPYAGCSFACFETIKYYIVKWNHLKSDREIPPWQRLVAGGLSGLLAQSATYPLDIVRRRMQVTPGRYKGIAAALATIYREEGLRQGLYKGLAMNWIKGPIATGTSFTVNDLVKRRTKVYYETTAQYSRRESLVTFPEAFVCGGIAAGIAKFWTVPFDRIKIMYQLGIADKEKANKRGVIHMFHMLRRNPNVWASANVTMVRVIPYGAITYSLFDLFKSIAERVMYSHEATVATNFVAGGAAAAVGTFVVYPLDLARTRTAASNAPGPRSYYWLFRFMARHHGISSLYEGCYFSMMSVGVLAGIGFASYEYLKAYYECETFTTRVLAGMAAGVVGLSFTYPLSVARRKRQAEHLIYGKTVKPIKPLFLNPRLFAALYRKMPFSWTLSSLTFGLSFAVNDCCRDVVVKARNDILHDLVFPLSD